MSPQLTAKILRELKLAVRDWLVDEHTPHLDKHGYLRDGFNEPSHGNPQDCLQCRVEELLLGKSRI